MSLVCARADGSTRELELSESGGCCDGSGRDSSYLFRVDDDTVVDATVRGGQARFINHRCARNPATPNQIRGRLVR